MTPERTFGYGFVDSNMNFPDDGVISQGRNMFGFHRGHAITAIGFIGIVVATCDQASSSSDGYQALFDNACAKVAALAYSRSYDDHVAELPSWIRLCNEHPDQAVCRDTEGTIKSTNPAARAHVTCGSQISDSNLGVFDDACAKVVATYYDKAERQNRVEIAGWVKTCNSHPDPSVL
jgi:hypothetical protein